MTAAGWQLRLYIAALRRDDYLSLFFAFASYVGAAAWPLGLSASLRVSP
jgi:hypothetical protein